eukprot:6103529-Amphidinium_carterae.2
MEYCTPGNNVTYSNYSSLEVAQGASLAPLHVTKFKLCGSTGGMSPHDNWRTLSAGSRSTSHQCGNNQQLANTFLECTSKSDDA